MWAPTQEAPPGRTGPPDERSDSHQRTTREPPPPNVIDLGNGEVMCVGTEADHRAAADWLARNYPDGPQGERYGPVRGPVLNMGYELRRMIRDGAPADWTPLMRLVAAEIADDARDPGENGLEVADDWPWSAIPVEGEYRHGKYRPGLAERTGMSPRAISRILTELAAAGYEMRTPITGKDGKPVRDKRGRLVYAAKGHAVRFQVPPLAPRDEPQRSPDSATFENSDESAPDPDKSARDESSPDSATFEAQRSPLLVAKVAEFGDPISSVSPQENQSPHASRVEMEGGSGGEPEKSQIDQPPENFEDRRRRELDRFEAWMREHPEAAEVAQ